MEFYRSCCDMIIRPPRDEYTEEDLGKTEFDIGNYTYQRTDLQLRNPRGHVLECSHWAPTKETRDRQKIPCVIYLHGNCGSRIRSLDAIEVVAAYGASLFGLDFSGAGKSEGDYISLGYHETEDVRVVISYLLGLGTVSSICLWGRSMGAVTALMYGSKNETPEVSCLILDSPFSSLQSIALEVGGTVEVGAVPRVVVHGSLSMGLGMLRRSIKNRAKFDLKKVAPIAVVKECQLPGLFLHGEEDDFISPKHSTELYEVYGGYKELLLVPGDHNSPRNGLFFTEVSRFLHTHLLDQSFKELTSHPFPVPPTHLPITKGEGWFLCQMVKDGGGGGEIARIGGEGGEGGGMFSVVLVVSKEGGVLLHSPFSEVITGKIPFCQIRAYGVHEGCFVLKWADKEYKKQEENEVDWEEGLVPRGLHFASFVTPESAKILETVEKVLEELLSNRMGIENLDDLIEQLVREREQSGETYTKEQLIESIGQLVKKRRREMEQQKASSPSSASSSPFPSPSLSPSPSPSLSRSLSLSLSPDPSPDLSLYPDPYSLPSSPPSAFPPSLSPSPRSPKDKSHKKDKGKEDTKKKKRKHTESTKEKEID